MKATLDRYIPLVIIVAATCVTVPRLAAAFAMIEPEFMGLKTAWVTGPGFGIAMASFQIYGWHTLRGASSRLTAQSSRRWLYVLLALWVLALAMVTLILLPGMTVTLRASAWSVALPYPLDTLWCAIVALAVDVVIAGAAVAMALQPQKREKSATSGPKPATSKPERFTCQHCSYVASTQSGLNAHQRKHKRGAE